MVFSHAHPDSLFSNSSTLYLLKIKVIKKTLLTINLICIIRMDDYRLIEVEGKKMYGKHFLGSFKNCDNKIRSLPPIIDFITQLVDLIDMDPVGEPVAHHIDKDRGNIGGFTVVQIIHTSTITFHSYDEAKDLYLDIFSCKDFDEKLALDFTKEYFLPEEVFHQTIYRP